MRRVHLVMLVCCTAAVLVLPSAASASGTISSLSINPDAVRGGAPSQGTVSLAFPDPSDTPVLVFSDDTSAATVPAQVVVPAGATSATFPIASNAAAPPTNVTITAWVGNTPRSALLSINAAAPAGPTLTAVSVTPTSIVGAGAGTGTVRFGGVTDGRVVTLSSSNTAVAQVPAQTVVDGGQSGGAFAVTTSAVTSPTPVTITATWFGVTRTTTITVMPGQPPAPDRVAIKKATWKQGLLTIEATSTNANAILSVFSRTGDFMFTLTNDGGGRYSDQRGFVFNPEQVTVRSNFGGSATASTTK
jgi:hypothetical protein